MVAGVGAGIDIDTSQHWVIEKITQPKPFFQQLERLLSSDAILYFEGGSIAPEVATFFLANEAKNPVAVIRDTIAPAPDIYHVILSPAVIQALCRFAEEYPPEKLFDHIKAYRGQTLLFTFHDAFSGWLRVSDTVPQQSVAAFCEALGVTWRREKTKQRDLEQLRRLLWAFENPDQVKISGPQKPWYARLWEKLSGFK